MRPDLRDYLYFNKAQRKGLVLIMLLAILAISYGEYLDYRATQELGEIQYKLSYLALEDTADITASHTPSIETRSNTSSQSIDYFEFNPNTISKDEWIKLGLSAKQAQAILNYREKGGQFRIRSDLKKMYTISDEKYKELENYILLPDQIDFKEKEWKNVERESDVTIKQIIELNTADSLQLIALKGIGPVYASRIIKYRSLLGGFYRIDQLKEVWGLKDSTILEISDQLSIDSTQIEKVNINQAEIKQLAAHPYINWNMAKTIFNYRTQHGNFENEEDLLKVKTISDKDLKKLRNYILY